MQSPDICQWHRQWLADKLLRMKTPTSRLVLALITALCAKGLAAQPAPLPGIARLQQMHDAYAGKWYSTLRFVQKTTQFRNDTVVNIATWYESLRQSPEGHTQLRIDLGDPQTGSGVLYTADSSWRFRAGKLLGATANGNEFLPLIEGVYVQPIEQTAKEIQSTTHVDFAKVGRTEWQGRPATIIGTSSASNLTVPQIWVDDERNVVVRALVGGRPGEPMLDIHLDDYVRVGGGWLATKIEMTQGGKRLQFEDYADWKAGIDLPSDLFSITEWVPKAHWAVR